MPTFVQTEYQADQHHGHVSERSARPHHEISSVMLVWYAWSFDEGWHLWATVVFDALTASNLFYECIVNTIGR